MTGYLSRAAANRAAKRLEVTGVKIIGVGLGMDGTYYIHVRDESGELRWVPERKGGDKMTSWLWPDHNIGKRESRRLREEHNALVNSHAELLDALQNIVHDLDAVNFQMRFVEHAKVIINKAEEATK